MMLSVSAPVSTVSSRRTPRRFALTSAVTLALGCATLSVQAQEVSWPAAKPIKLVVPFPAGGSTDSIGRLLAHEMAAELKQSVVIENRPGANGSIGSEQVAKSPADGYTLLLSGIGSNAIAYSLYKSLGYSDASFRHVSLLATGPQVIVVGNEIPVTDLQGLIKLAKSQPGKFEYGSAGAGSGGHLTMELLKQKAGLQMVHIPYKGFGAALTDVMGGRVASLALNNDGALPLVKAGKLKALAVTSAARNPAFPNVPTLAESGIPGVEVVSWFGLSVPAGTPAATVQKLSAAAMRGMQAPKVQQFLRDSGFVVVGSKPEEFASFVQADIARWQAVVKQANITLD